MNAVDKTRSESRSAIMWGIVGMVIMFSVFGLIQVVLGTFGLTKSDINSTDSEKILNL
jgi:hypothetical protein